MNSKNYSVDAVLTKTRIEQIIEDATMDCYSEEEVFSGWFCFLEEKLLTPQECQTGKTQGVLVKLLQAQGGLAIHAKIRLEKQKSNVIVPIEYVVLLDKQQDIFVQAYKQWLV